MILMLDGVQGSGKSTIIEHLTSRNDFRGDVIALERSSAFKKILAKVPLMLDRVTLASQTALLKQILNCWDEQLRTAAENPRNLYLMDRSPINSMAFQSLIFDYLSENEEAYRRFKANYVGDAPSQIRLASMSGTLQTIMYDYFRHRFVTGACAKHSAILNVFLDVEANEAVSRVESRAVARKGNTQDWFVKKSDEIDLYSMANRIARTWIIENFKYENYIPLKVSTNVDIDNTLSEIVSNVKQYG